MTALVPSRQNDSLCSTQFLTPACATLNRSPVDPSSLVIKRLVALPGSIVKTLDPYPEKTVRIPPGHCWIEGDEQYHSRDSNTYGPVPLGLVNAKVEWIVWPPR